MKDSNFYLERVLHRLVGADALYPPDIKAIQDDLRAVRELTPIGAITASPGTQLVCSQCGITAEESGTGMFYVRRYRGLYKLLCFRNGRGCWERSPRGYCMTVEPNGDQCRQLAEYEVRKANGEVHASCCRQHLADNLPLGESGISLFPIDD